MMGDRVPKASIAPSTRRWALLSRAVGAHGARLSGTIAGLSELCEDGPRGPRYVRLSVVNKDCTGCLNRAQRAWRLATSVASRAGRRYGIVLIGSGRHRSSPAAAPG